MAEIVEMRPKGQRSEYYVTFVGENRRLDEWVAQERICAVASDSPAVDDGKVPALFIFPYRDMVSFLFHF